MSFTDPFLQAGGKPGLLGRSWQSMDGVESCLRHVLSGPRGGLRLSLLPGEVKVNNAR